MQLTRHKKKCEHAVSPSDRSYIFSGETQLFECESCSKTFTISLINQMQADMPRRAVRKMKL